MRAAASLHRALFCAPQMASPCSRRLLSRLAARPSQHSLRPGYSLLQTRAVLESVVTSGTPAAASPSPGPEPISSSTTYATSAAATAGTPPSSTITPADMDRLRFQLHWSVDMWCDYFPSKWYQNLTQGDAPTTERLRQFAQALQQALSSAGILGSSEAARYWVYHMGRSGFFMMQGVAGILTARRVVGATGDAEQSPMTRMEAVFKGGWAGPFGDALLTFWQDHELIKEGKFALPWDMTTAGHRQFNPLFVLQRSAAFLSEAAATLARRERGEADPLWLKSALLPDYFQDTFHYQTDGWMSAKSASVYETSTETLFVGRQDAMQRSTLVHISDYMKGKDASQMRALEVAAGTGRFATYVKDNYPSLHLTVSDLSPFYLAKARENLDYWKRMRAPGAQLGGIEDTGCAYLQTAAEAIDAPDESFDVVYSVYLFHELPADVRAKAAKEMARVCKPGGLVVLTDSVQLGDRAAYDPTLGRFGNFNEPYYDDYIRADIGALFEAAGLRCGTKVLSSSTKSLSFFKPLPGEEAAAEPAKPAEVDVIA